MYFFNIEFCFFLFASYELKFTSFLRFIVVGCAVFTL